MSKLIFGTVALSALLLVGMGGCKGSGNGSASGNLGTVDGDPITNDEFFAYLQHKPMVQVTAGQGRSVQAPVAGSLGVQAMRDLVQQKMLQQIAKEEGVLPTKDDVDKELEFRKRQNASYIDNLEHAGLTMDDIRNDTLNALISDRLQTKGIVVSDSEAKSFISSHRSEFTTPAQANLLILAVNDAKKKAAADTDLKGGQSFAAVAMQYSIVPGARESGGAFQIHSVAEMEPALQALVKSTPEGKSTEWKKDGANWIRFYIQSKTPAKPMPVDSTLIEEVKRDLAKQKGAPNATDLKKRIIAKIKSSKVELAIPAYQEGWKQYQDQLSASAR